MAKDPISHWVENAKNATAEEPRADGVKVIRRERSKGSIILDIAEKLRPWLAQQLSGVRDNNGMLVQPSTIRAIALNAAQILVKKQEEEFKKKPH